MNTIMMTDLIIKLPLQQPVAIFMVVLAIIIFSPLLLRRLKIPDIVGLIVAGVIIGPYGFNILARDASFQIFGQVGILYLMFLAAVEIDMYNLKKNLKSGLLFGIITFILPLIGGIVITKYAFGIGMTTAVLLAVMFSSHTLVAYPVVSKFGLSNTRGAVVAVCGTIVAVLLSLIALAEVVEVRQRGYFDFMSLLGILGITVIYAGVVGWSYPVITRYFFRKVTDGVWQFVFILGMLCFASLLASLVGLESILGAFYAGLVLNRFIPVRSALMGRIEFVGKAIFIPYFMIGVGMLINVGVLVDGWGVIIAVLTMVGVALGTKWVSAWLSCRILNLTSYDRGLMFGLSSGKAAATIAATMIGFQYGLLTEDLMNGAVVMILVCCIVSSVVTERVALRLRMKLTGETLERDGVESTGYARQLVAVSNPVTAEGLMRLAVFMRNPSNDQPITALFVRSNDSARMLSMGRSALSVASKAAMAMEVNVKEVERYDVNAVTGVVNVLHEHKGTDIIIGLHRKSNIVDTFYGVFIESLLRETDKMVVISRCFMPVDTLRRLVVVVPSNAEYETGFHAWVARIGNLGVQLGCKVIFMSGGTTADMIENVIEEDGYGIRRIYQNMDTWDDFILLSGEIGDEDLLVVVGARKGSISHSSELEEMPGFLSRHFSAHNLVVIYPEQFGG